MRTGANSSRKAARQANPGDGRVRCLSALLLFALAAGPLCAQVRKVIDAMAPMRDGVRLATKVLLPEGEGPWPAILTRTPYGMERNLQRPDPWPRRGYARVLQDCRGRFKSEGKFRPFEDDLEDGYDTIEWIAAQKWSNGQVGMLGGSAPGAIANLAVMSGAPHLVCAFVNVAHADPYHIASFPGGVFLSMLNENWLRNQGVPMPEMPRPIFRVYDESYARREMRSYYSKIAIPMYNTGGWYDIFSQGTIDNFVGLQTQGAGRARGNQKLLMRPQAHGANLDGDLKYPNAEAIDPQAQARWFDYWLKEIDNGIMKEPPIRYYLMGDPFDQAAPGNQWRTADSWPPQAHSTAYYLHARNLLSLEAPRAEGGSDSYVYDPRNPVPTQGGNNLGRPHGPLDQRSVSRRPDVLRYETQPLVRPIEIVGRVYADLWVSTDAEDTDFMVKFIDVYPSGYEALMLDEPFRLRYHQGFDKMTRVEKGKVYRIKVDLWSTALVFNKGHKVAVHVSNSNWPRFERHSNTWEPVKTYDASVNARNTVYRDAQHPSRILLPVTRIHGQSP